MIITAITNFLFASLTEEEFADASIIVAELSKSMFSMLVLKEIEDKKRDAKK